DAIRELVDEMQRAERTVLLDRSAAAHVSARLTLLVLLVGDLLAFALVGSSYIIAMRGLAERHRHVVAVEEARGQAERQAAELATLARDRDEARRAAQEASRLKSEFLATMSHEIRTPMTALVGYTEMLGDADLSPAERAECLATVRRNGEHLMAIVNDILDLSKIESGRMTIERIACSPFALVAEVAAVVRPRAARDGLTFAVEYRSPLPETIETDPTRLRQILLNLVGNAIKFTPRGSVRLGVALLEDTGPPRRLRFEVIDTGIGLDAQQQARLFTAFAQADASTTRRFGGTGLGLAISKRLAGMLGGDLQVRSVPGEGSTFTLTIDAGSLAGVRLLDRPPDLPAAAERREPSADERRALRGRILLAEDGLDARRLLARHLRAAGAEVETAENGLVACELALRAADAGTPYDLILMDMQMPELDGYAAAARLRAAGYRGPIVALTAHAMEDERARCLDAGCDGFAAKPILRRALIEVARTYLAPGGAAPLVSALATDVGIAHLLDGFVRRLPERLGAMERALGTRDLEVLADLAHQLKGAASGYGFPAITEAAAELEAVAAARGEVERALAALADVCRRAAGAASVPDPKSVA
ncbi:MAG: response regulator, partial [Deltaproteobacteria bacterium]